MNPLQSSLYIGLIYSLPLCIWYLPQLEYHASGSSMQSQEALRILLLTQGMMIVLWTGGETERFGRRPNLAGLCLLLLVPLPLLALIRLSGTPTSVLSQAEGSLLLFGLVLLLQGRVLQRLPLGPIVRDIAHHAWQSGLLLLIWVERDTWLGWFDL
ncbi:MAG: hypothetical protein KDI83_16370 [Gammaproteobacteria bacterium]|nr:hypothetical protein [Gammaproteobacteria bacterium]